MLLVGLLASCGRSSENGSSAKRNDSLERVVAQNDVFASMNAVAENLSAIKLRENIINASLDSGEIPKQSAVKINEDIAAIDRLLQENRRTINRPQQSADQLKKANVRVASLEKLIAQQMKEDQK